MTTATHEPITRSEALSAEEAARHRLALKVHYATHDGDALIQSLMEFVNGDITDAKTCHIHAADGKTLRKGLTHLRTGE